MSAATSVIKLATVTHNGAEVGIAIRAVIEYAPNDVPIYGQGATYMKALGTTHSVVRATIDYIGNTVVDPDTAAAATVVTGYDTAGNPHTTTLATMKPRGWTKTGVIQGEDIISQTYVHVSANGTTYPIAFG
jgi:hypothetical protein